MKAAFLGFLIAISVGVSGRSQTLYSGFSLSPTDGGTPISAAQAPVQSVNAQQGAVTVPSSIRASCTVTTFDASGNGTCSLSNFQGGSAFTALPDCDATWSAGSSSYVYAAPIVTRSQTAPTVVAQSAQKILNITLGLTTVWGAPPAGSTLYVFCRGN